ncbi:MAG: hypothetical protein WC941_00810 [Candidatus Bathyarchaeia archaeon]
MNSFDTYLLRRIYKKIAKLGDKLAEADAQIDWTTLRPIIKDLYTNDTEQGGRPNADEVVMVKKPDILVQRSPAPDLLVHPPYLPAQALHVAQVVVQHQPVQGAGTGRGLSL